MAIYNEILVGRFNRALQKLTAIKGGAPVKQLGSEMMPGWNLPLGVEFRYLEGWETFAGNFSIAAGAGAVSALRIRNPATSGVIAVFFKLSISNFNAAAQGYQFQTDRSIPPVGDLSTGAGAPNAGIDLRGRANPSLIFSTQNTAGSTNLGNGAGQFILPVSGNYDLMLDGNHELPFLPGSALQFLTTGTNVSLNVTFWWRERALEESERT